MARTLAQVEAELDGALARLAALEARFPPPEVLDEAPPPVAATIELSDGRVITATRGTLEDLARKLADKGLVSEDVVALARADGGDTLTVKEK